MRTEDGEIIEQNGLSALMDAPPHSVPAPF